MTAMGCHIVLEGRDSVGKTVQVPRVAAALRERFGVEVLETREPGATPLGSRLREVLLESDVIVGARARLLLFAADNAQHIDDVVVPALEAGTWVVSDRGMGSALAYQGFGFGFGTPLVQRIYGWAVDNHTETTTVLLDCDDRVIAERAAVHGEPPDNIERLPSEFHARVRDGYRELARLNPSWIGVDASAGIPEVTDRIVDAVEQHLRRNRIA